MLGEGRLVTVLVALCAQAFAQSLTTPAGIRPAHVGTVSILPGGRVVAPLGEQYVTGANPVALAVSPSGKLLVTVNRGGGRPSVTIMQNEKAWEIRQLQLVDLRSVTYGLAFSGEHSVFVSGGDTGRILLVNLETEEQRRSVDLEPGSITADLAYDSARNILYLADLAHNRVVVVEARSRQVLASIPLEGQPVVLALGPDHRKLYVALTHNESTGSVCLIDVSMPRAPRIESVVPLHGDLAGLAVSAESVFISDKADDSIAVLDARTGAAVTRIPIRISGLEALRGVSPMGMASDESSGRLLVAEAGINALGIIDARSRTVNGHVPVGWFPTRVAVRGGMVFVANGKGPSGGPNTRGSPVPWGSVSMFPMPQAGALAAESQFVLEAAGLVNRATPPPALPAAIRHVVLVVKDGRTFDEVLGDLPQTAIGAPPLARFGRDGYADGQRQRLSLHHLNVTPNQHAIAQRWTFSDNFYADADTSAEGLRRLTEWNELTPHGVSVYRFRDPFDAKTHDTERTRRAIAEIESKFANGSADLPGLVVIELPNDRIAAPDPGSGFPYGASYVADNDLAVGRLVEYFSATRWWGQMALFVTEASAEDGVDHLDAHRTLLLCAGPWARKNSVAHANTSFAGLRKTILRLLGVPPVSLSDAAAADLSECFAKTPDLAPYHALPVDPRLYQP
jgi:DNA-binding beta-propeller fold protein YncE